MVKDREAWPAAVRGLRVRQDLATEQRQPCSSQVPREQSGDHSPSHEDSWQVTWSGRDSAQGASPSWGQGQLWWCDTQMQPLQVGPPSSCAGLLCWQFSCKLQASVLGHVLFTPSFIAMGSLQPDCSFTWAPSEGLSWWGPNSCSAECVMVFLLNVVTRST